jgi:hypothetical protein
MKYAVEIGSGATICVPSFRKTGSNNRKLIGGGIYRQHGDRLNLLPFFPNKESKLKRGGKN